MELSFIYLREKNRNSFLLSVYHFLSKYPCLVSSGWHKLCCNIYILAVVDALPSHSKYIWTKFRSSATFFGSLFFVSLMLTILNKELYTEKWVLFSSWKYRLCLLYLQFSHVLIIANYYIECWDDERTINWNGWGCFLLTIAWRDCEKPWETSVKITEDSRDLKNAALEYKSEPLWPQPPCSLSLPA